MGSYTREITNRIRRQLTKHNIKTENKPKDSLLTNKLDKERALQYDM